jgi:cation transport ATPase
MIYQVVHSTLGRYRIRVPKLASDTEFSSNLKALVESFAFVTEVRINEAASSLIVGYKTSAISDAIALEKVVSCLYQAEGVEFPLAETEVEEPDLKPEFNEWQDLGWPLLSLSLSLLIIPLELPPLIVVLAIATAAMPWLNRSADGLLNHRQPNVDMLDWSWMALQTARGQYIAPALKTVLVEARRTLRGNTVHTREQQAQTLLNQLKQSVWVERDGQTQRIPAHQLQVGDRVTFSSGDMILIDGRIINGTGLIDLQNLTGETVSQAYSEGQQIYASTVLLEGRIYVLVERAGANTRAGLAAYLAQSAPIHDTHIGAQQAELVRHAVMPTLFFGGTVYLITGNIGAAISPYQFDFGSGIPISLSTTVLQALTYAACHGVYIRSGRVLEVLAHVDAVIFEQVEALNPDNPASREVIATLHRQNIATYLISTADAAATFEMAQRLGIHAEHTCAEMLAAQKLHLLQGLRHHGKTVALVGAAGDNTLTLAQANVSVVFSRSSEISHETADVVILDEDIRGVTHAIAIAKRAMNTIYQNTATIVIPNLLMQIGGGMVLGLNPVSNVIVNNSSAFIAEFLNGPRPLFEAGELPLLGNCSRKTLKETQGNSTSLLPAAPGFPLTSAVQEKQPDESLSQRSLRQSDLAKRLGVASQALTHQRSKPEFATWTQAKDPERIAWLYDSASKCYRHS